MRNITEGRSFGVEVGAFEAGPNLKSGMRVREFNARDMARLPSASFINMVGHTDRFIGISDKKIC